MSKQSDMSMAADISKVLATRFGREKQNILYIPKLHSGSRRGRKNFIKRAFPDISLQISEDAQNGEVIITEAPSTVFTAMYSGPNKLDYEYLKSYNSIINIHAGEIPLKDISELFGFTEYGFVLLNFLLEDLRDLYQRDFYVLANSDTKIYNKVAKYNYKLEWVYNLNSNNCGYYVVTLAEKYSMDDVMQAFAELISFGAKINKEQNQCIFTKFPKQLLGV